MTALPNVPGVLKVVIDGTVKGEPWVGISHWRFVTSSGPLTGDNVNHMMAHFVDSLRDNWVSVLADDVTVSGVTGTDLTTTTSAIGTAAASLTGGGPAPAISPEACILERKLIGRRYRGGHPRTYWPGPYSSLTVGGNNRQILDTPHTGLNEDINSYYGDIPPAITTDSDTNCTSFHEVCVHYVMGGVHLSTPLVDDILGQSIDIMLATQRRRMHRGG